MSDSPRIYVACLASYNSGTLHGRWIDATQDADDIRAEITAMLQASPEPGAEEYAIHDYEGFAPLRLSEYESIDRVAEIAQGIEEHGEPFAAFLSLDEEGTVEQFEDAYRGTYESEKEFAEEFVDECGLGGLEKIPESLAPYIDYDMVARDLMQDFNAVQSSDYRVHIFWSNY